MRGMDRRLAAPESEAFTLSDSSLQLTKARSNFQLDSGKGIRLPETTEANPLTIGSEGEMRKGRLESRRAPTALPPGARASNREFAEQWVQKARGGQQAWRPRGQEPRGALEAGGSRLRSERPRRARPRSLPATGAAAASAARWARAAAAHWCGTTIGTSLRFCLQSNPSIKRGTKSPLITPCHKVICPGGKPWHRSARSVCVLERVRGAMWGGGAQRKGELSQLFSRENRLDKPCPSRPGKQRVVRTLARGCDRGVHAGN